MVLQSTPYIFLFVLDGVGKKFKPVRFTIPNDSILTFYWWINYRSA